MTIVTLVSGCGYALNKTLADRDAGGGARPGKDGVRPTGPARHRLRAPPSCGNRSPRPNADR